MCPTCGDKEKKARVKILQAIGYQVRFKISSQKVFVYMPKFEYSILKYDMLRELPVFTKLVVIFQ